MFPFASQNTVGKKRCFTMQFAKKLVWTTSFYSIVLSFANLVILCSACHMIVSLTPAIDIDGAYFGTTFPHLFLMTYGHLKPQKPSQSYISRIFGFKLHKPWYPEVGSVIVEENFQGSNTESLMSHIHTIPSLHSWHL